MSETLAPAAPVLAKSDQNLVWLDCEMTGLNPEVERILEIAVVVTSPHLDVRIEGPVLAAEDAPAVGINLFDGEPYVLRNMSGIVWAPVRHATLSRDGQAIATYNGADS